MSDSVRPIAYVDEAGRFGLVRDITPDDDHLIAVLAAVVFEPEQRERAIHDLTPPFEAFKRAAPLGAKLHITDAFAPGNEEWAAVAREVRETYLSTLACLSCPIIYAARRHRIARWLRDTLDHAIEAYPAPPSPIRVIGSERPDPERIEDTVMKYLALRLDAYADDHGIGLIDVIFDSTDDGVMRRYQAAVARTKSISSTVHTVHGWHRDDQKRVSATVRSTVSSSVPVDTQFVGKLLVSEKDDPLVLAADIAANSINHHLVKLAADAPLHIPETMQGWTLHHLLWGNRDSPIEDIL